MSLKSKLIEVLVDEVVDTVKEEMILYYRETEIEPEKEPDLFHNIRTTLASQLYYG